MSAARDAFLAAVDAIQEEAPTYRSAIASNVWTPKAYPAGWEAAQ